MGFLPQYFYNYERLARNEGEDVEEVKRLDRRKSWTVAILLFLFALFGVVRIGRNYSQSSSPSSCDSIDDGYQCSPELSNYWGQYSPYYRVPSDISDDTPKHCEVTFANVLSRHGARDPTLSKSLLYGAFIAALKQNVTKFEGKYAFLNSYEYSLGADMLNAFGKQQMVNSGIKFYNRYKHLRATAAPFLRTAGQQRVVDSANLFATGFHRAYVQDKGEVDNDYPYSLVVIPEANTSNNTLSYGLCNAYRAGWPSHTESAAKGAWAEIFTEPLLTRLREDLPGAQLSKSDVLIFLDLCPFETVANPQGKISEFCHLFSIEEWKQFDYYESLGKWYGFGNGNYFGATNGVGYVNELIARLTNSPVQDHTSTNRTLDQNPETFPIDEEHRLFADFSHDNDLTNVIAALGLYNSTAQLSNTTYESIEETKGYSASSTVPFAARIYIEKLKCSHEKEERVRVLVNDRVIPLPWCGGKKDGICKLSKFVEGLSFARHGGLWHECFE